jgi:hypothetical protein
MAGGAAHRSRAQARALFTSNFDGWDEEKGERGGLTLEWKIKFVLFT